MTLKSLKILLAATALGVGALAYSGPADARVRGRTHYGWHYGWYKGWHRGPVVASDYDVAPRRACDDDYVVASDYVAPRAYDYGYCEPTAMSLLLLKSRDRRCWDECYAAFVV